jgi:FolB domain-containing protein
MRFRDSISLSDWESMVFVGILPKEHAAPQRVGFSITLWLDLEACAENANLSESVNYADVLSSVTALAGGGHWPLLESLGRAICGMLLLPPLNGGQAQVASVEVKMSKPDILGGVATPTVTLRRDAPMRMPTGNGVTVLHSEATISAVVQQLSTNESLPTDGEVTLLSVGAVRRVLVVRTAAYSL